jgi:DNA polymerase-3 subunit delta'
MKRAADLHGEVWRRLDAWRAQLPHALLLSGPRGLGKRQLAQDFAAALLCEAPAADGHACGACLACRWFVQDSHPDFRLLQPEAHAAPAEGRAADESRAKRGGQQITIDQVRALDDFLAVGTHRQGLRIVLIQPAENLNRSAANALLKMLEEPPPDTVFLLVSDEPARLLPTVLSRCQSLPFAVPPRDAALAFLQAADLADAEIWLALAGGAPCLALELAARARNDGFAELMAALGEGGRLEVLATAAALEKPLKAGKGENPLPQWVDWLLKWLVDLNLAAHGLPIRFYLRHGAKIEALARQSRPEKLVRAYRALLVLRRESEQPLNLRLFLERFLFEYRALFVE